MKNLFKALVVGGIAFPMFAFAQTTRTLFDLMTVLINLIGVIAPFIIGLAVLVILWGVFGYIAGAGDEEKRAQSKLYIIWGIIGLFVMVAIWGLVGIVSRTANFANFTAQSPQVVPSSSGLIRVGGSGGGGGGS